MQVVRASTLAEANRGVLVVDGYTLTSSKHRLGLTLGLAKKSFALGTATATLTISPTALFTTLSSSRQYMTHSDSSVMDVSHVTLPSIRISGSKPGGRSAPEAAGPASVLVPITATVWAASHGFPIAASGGGGRDEGSAGGEAPAMSMSAMCATGAVSFDGFNLVMSFTGSDDDSSNIDGMQAKPGGCNNLDAVSCNSASSRAALGLRHHMYRVMRDDRDGGQRLKGPGGFSPKAVLLLQV